MAKNSNKNLSRMPLEISKKFLVILSFRFSQIAKPKMTNFDEEMTLKTVKIFDLSIDEKMKPSGLNKEKYPDAVRKIGR